MANILQVSKSAVSAKTEISDHSGVRSQESVTLHPERENISVQDPAARQLEQEGRKFIHFESNVQNFLSRLSQGMSLSKELNELFFRDLGTAAEISDPETDALYQALLKEMDLQNPEQLMEFMDSINRSQRGFAGDFFQSMQSILSAPVSQQLKDEVFQFVKSFDNMSAGPHLLVQLKDIGNDLTQLIVPSARQQFTALLNEINWEETPGNTERNAKVMNEKIIPFLAKYISKNHHYGAVRTASAFFVLYAAKYENGDQARLRTAFARLLKNASFRSYFQKDPEESFQELVKQAEQKQMGESRFPELFAEMLERGAEGKAGGDSIERYMSVLNSLLMNESVYMPLLHMLIPFHYQDKNVVSEMWVDPDAEDESINKVQRFFVKFQIEDKGSFELVSTVKDASVSMQMFIPHELTMDSEQMNQDIQEILKRNGLKVKSLLITGKERDLRVDEVFPKIRERAKSINVKV